MRRFVAEYGVVEVYEDPPRSCVHCKLEAVAVDRGGIFVRRDDACIANLPGVVAACCGHGRGRSGGLYVYLEGGDTFYGDDAVPVLRALGGHPPS